ncbi:MAG: hypothetical protein JWM43_3361 [Acidobacteriaceae bacterium]|jgi:hypothetical protein|nr:hypothetical protein [Acidobacteriaceae bacterium]
MSRCTLRYVFTIIMYAGIVVFLIPYVSGEISKGTIFLIIGGAVAVSCGMLRCYFSESSAPQDQHFPTKPCP